MKGVTKYIKHYVNHPVATATSGALGGFAIAATIAEGATRTASSDVEEGAKIEAVFCEFWLSGVTLDKTAIWILLKLPSGAPAPTVTEMNNLSTYANKKNILKSGQGLAPTNGNVVPVLREWVKIPKGKQRFGLSDALSFYWTGTGTSVNVCGLNTYKEGN